MGGRVVWHVSSWGDVPGWCVTSEMRAKIRAADWRRATGISAGREEPCGGAAAAVWSQLDLGHWTRSTTKKDTSDSVNNTIWTIMLSGD